LTRTKKCDIILTKEVRKMRTNLRKWFKNYQGKTTQIENELHTILNQRAKQLLIKENLKNRIVSDIEDVFLNQKCEEVKNKLAPFNRKKVIVRHTGFLVPAGGDFIPDLGNGKKIYKFNGYSWGPSKNNHSVCIAFGICYSENNGTTNQWYLDISQVVSITTV